MQLIHNLSSHPMVCIVVSAFIFIVSYFSNYLILDSLLKMNRSKTAVKKLKKEYTNFQKWCLLHFKGNFCHAVKFCDGLILFQKIGWIIIAAYFVVSLLFVFGILSATVITWFSLGILLVFDIPSFAISCALTRPIIGRFREYSFEKYHNTNDHESLF